MRASGPLLLVIVTGAVASAAACATSIDAKVGATTTSGAGGTTGSGGTSTTAQTSSGTTSTTMVPPTGTCAPTEDAGTGTFPFPSVVSYDGKVTAAAKIVSVTFAGDATASQLDAFGAGLASSCYWNDVRPGFCDAKGCVGDGPAGISVALTTKPAKSYSDASQGGGTLQTFLEGLIAAKTVPAPDGNTIYALYFPPSTSIEMDGGKSCQDFDGYHGSMPVGNQIVEYAVIPECAAPPMTPAITDLQNTTLTASHEALETVTDGDGNGFYLDLTQESSWGWEDIQGGEVGDLCVDPFLLGLDEFTENGFTVQRIWSVANASAGKNPCVPIPAGEVYFNAHPAESVLVMDVGDSKTIEVDALADGPMPAWSVLPQDWTDYQTQYLSFSISGGTNTDAGPTLQMKSGDKMMLTVTLLADPANTQNGEADGVIVSANAADPNAVTAAHFWPFVVVTTAEAADGGISMMKRARRHGRRVHRPRRQRPVFGGWH